MAIEIIVPRLGWSMDEGTFSEWLVKEEEISFTRATCCLCLKATRRRRKSNRSTREFCTFPLTHRNRTMQSRLGQLLAFLLAEGESPPDPTQPATVFQVPAVACDQRPPQATTSTRPDRDLDKFAYHLLTTGAARSGRSW